MECTIRTAGPDDAEIIHDFIVGLAVFEREPDAVETTPAGLRAQLASERPPFDCLIAELDGVPCGFALYFQNYSTWKGVPGIHLEDLFVPEEHRGNGIGKALLAELSRIAVARGCARLEWQVLDWNESAITFYEGIGADILREWLPVRLTGAALTALADTATPR